MHQCMHPLKSKSANGKVAVRKPIYPWKKHKAFFLRARAPLALKAPAEQLVNSTKSNQSVHSSNTTRQSLALGTRLTSPHRRSALRTRTARLPSHTRLKRSNTALTPQLTRRRSAPDRPSAQQRRAHSKHSSQRPSANRPKENTRTARTHTRVNCPACVRKWPR